jgi:hypothetical protein
MSLRRRLRTIFLCMMLEYAALLGMPMRPEEIDELMHTMNQPKRAHTIPKPQEKDDN